MVCSMLKKIAADDMAETHWQMVKHEPAAPEKKSRYRLDELNAARIAKNLVILAPTEAIIADLMAKARLSIPGLADTSEIVRIMNYNPDLMLPVVRKSRLNPDAPLGEGLIAFLPLNLLGMQHLALGTFNAAVPDERLLAKPNERPAGIYLWCIFAPGPLAGISALFMERLSSDQFSGVNIYARPVTDDGRRFSQLMGLTPGIVIGDIHAPNVWVFTRKSLTPSYDSYSPDAGKHAIGIAIVRTVDDMLRVAAIRNAVYIGEQECPYEEEYDGNDLSGTHLLAYIGKEPVGCLRLRFFAGFAKLERLAIRKEFRKSQAAFHLVRAALKFCQKKGYGRVYLHSQARLIDFWARFHFQVMEGRSHFVFSDFDYVEMTADLEPDAEALTLEANPYVLIRPEGRWHVPGVLEQSAARAPTSPSALKKR